MSLCTYCGHNVSPEAKICYNCGADLELQRDPRTSVWGCLLTLLLCTGIFPGVLLMRIVSPTTNGTAWFASSALLSLVIGLVSLKWQLKGLLFYITLCLVSSWYLYSTDHPQVVREKQILTTQNLINKSQDEIKGLLGEPKQKTRGDYHQTWYYASFEISFENKEKSGFKVVEVYADKKRVQPIVAP